MDDSRLNHRVGSIVLAAFAGASAFILCYSCCVLLGALFAALLASQAHGRAIIFTMEDLARAVPVVLDVAFLRLAAWRC
jgi:hypothetical protein